MDTARQATPCLARYPHPTLTGNRMFIGQHSTNRYGHIIIIMMEVVILIVLVSVVVVVIIMVVVMIVVW